MAAVRDEATEVWFSWTYLNAPSPEPSCAIDHEVGPVVSGAKQLLAISTDTTYTLTCTNSAGSDVATTTIAAVPDAVPPILQAFTATPASVVAGIAASVAFAWSYANAPTPEPVCTLDHGIGALQNGSAHELMLAADTVFTLDCTNRAGSDTAVRWVTVTIEPAAPALAMFTATPTRVVSGVSTDVVFTWTYANLPSPDAVCTIAPDVGTLANGGSASVTLTADTEFALDCANSEGSDSLTTNISVMQPGEFEIVGLAAAPAALIVNEPTEVMWRWGLRGDPVGPMACVVNRGIGAVGSGTATLVTLTQTQTYELSCSTPSFTAHASLTLQGLVPGPEPIFAVGPTPMPSVSVARAHVCALKADRTAACWGAGQRNASTGVFTALSGTDEVTCGLTPTGSLDCWGSPDDYFDLAAAPAGSFVAMAVGSSHACAVAGDGHLECWGDDLSGQSTPPLGTFLSVSVGSKSSAGVSHSCGITGDHKVICWGDDAYGQLASPSGSYTATAVGALHACALSTVGAVVCWGNNAHGQLDAPAGTFTALAAGTYHTCGLKTDKTVECWGYLDGSYAPASPSGSFATLACSDLACCGVKTDGQIACWGNYIPLEPPTARFVALPPTLQHQPLALKSNNRVSVLGGDAVSPFDANVVDFSVLWDGCALRTDGTVACWFASTFAPMQAPAGEFTNLGIGSDFGCGIRPDNHLECWGDNTLGQSTPPEGQFTSVGVGYSHACAISVEGTLACWGSTDAGDVTTPAGEFSAVNVGLYFSCGLRSDQTLFCWSDGWPGLVSPPAGRYLAVAVGDRHACAINQQRNVVCWGSDEVGQATPPTGVYVALALADRSSCAVRDDSRLVCWGEFVR